MSVPYVFTTYDQLKTAVNEWVEDKDLALIKYGPINEWNTTSITNMRNLFSYQSTFNENISGWDTSNVTDMCGIFYGATRFNNGDVEGDSNTPLTWDTSQVIDMSYMFSGINSNEENQLIFNQDISSWNTSNVMFMNNMFYNARLFNQDISTKIVTSGDTSYTAWDTSNVSNMGDMFNNANSFNQFIGNWNTGKVTNMSYLFRKAETFNNGKNSGEGGAPLNWNTAMATNMRFMFRDAKAFNQYIGDWDTSNVTSMLSMLDLAVTFNNGKNEGQGGAPLNWNTAKVTDMRDMFFLCDKFNQYIGNWNTSNVISMSGMLSSIFFNNGEIPGEEGAPLNWDTAKVTDMSSMFYFAFNFNQPIGNWDTSNVTDMSSMFRNSSNFNQDITNWNVANVTTMQRMFNLAIAFNKNITGWNTNPTILGDLQFLQANNWLNTYERKDGSSSTNGPPNLWQLKTDTREVGLSFKTKEEVSDVVLDQINRIDPRRLKDFENI